MHHYSSDDLVHNRAEEVKHHDLSDHNWDKMDGKKYNVLFNIHIMSKLILLCKQILYQYKMKYKWIVYTTEKNICKQQNILKQ